MADWALEKYCMYLRENRWQEKEIREFVRFTRKNYPDNFVKDKSGRWTLVKNLGQIFKDFKENGHTHPN